MKRFIIFILLLIFTNISAVVKAANIIYPKENEVTINAPSTFFVGNENPDNQLKINNEIIQLSKNGGFFHPVELNIGENIFTIDDGNSQIIYKILRKEIPAFNEPQTVTKFPTPKIAVIVSNNVPLRSIPFDRGITRLQHFDRGMPINIVGEYNGFYKVQLSRDDFGWISKKSAKEISGYNNSPANFEGFIYEENSENHTYIFKLSKKVPYILSERIKYETKDTKNFYKVTNGLDLTIYNVKNYPENKLELNINKTNLNLGYKSYYKNNNELVIEVKKPNKITDLYYPLKDLKITLDAGHGGNELGAIGCLGTKEKDVNLQIVLKLKKQLENAGAKVFLARSDDENIDLQTRVKISQDNHSDVFISIHNDSLPNGSKITNPSGSTAYVFYPQSTKLAREIIETLSEQTGLKNNGVKEESFAVIRNTESLAVLLEVAYMISPEDNENLITEEFQNSIAKAIKEGMEKYFNENK